MSRFVVVATMLALAGCNSVQIKDDSGGVIRAYEARYKRLESSGAKVELSGTVASAATIYVGLKNACTYRDTEFKFHGASVVFAGISAPSPIDTQRLANYYPNKLRVWFYSSGAYDLRGKNYKSLYGNELIAWGIVKEC
jgi:hypothetical protein